MNSKKQNLENGLNVLKALSRAIPKDDDAITPYLRDTMLKGDPDVVLRPRDKKDLLEIFRLCLLDKIPLTFCGAQTSMTGSSVALSGALVSIEKMDQFIDIVDNDNIVTATAECGIPLAEFKRIIEGKGYFYPMHPTSVNDIFFAPTVATNATGDDSYKYGSTRNWVNRIKVLMLDGREVELNRSMSRGQFEVKGRGGYFLDGEEIDYFIGSEGSLGLITEVTVDILKGVPDYYSLMIPFATNNAALKFVQYIALKQKMNPRSLEFIDSMAVSVMRKNETFPEISEEVLAIVYLHQEYPKGDFNESLSNWFAVLEEYGLENKFIEMTMAGITEKEKSDMHEWRHFIPEHINDTYRKYEKFGGGKIGGDWWVPMEKMLEMMNWFYEISEASAIPYIGYGHLGNGHPHTNYFTRNQNERLEALKLVKDASKRAVEHGGGVAGEHGIGKIKRFLMPIQYSQKIIDKMKKIKTHYDPDWLLGQGNIF